MTGSRPAGTLSSSLGLVDRIVTLAAERLGASRAVLVVDGTACERSPGALVVPLIDDGHRLGELHIEKDGGGSFSDAERTAAESFGAAAALALSQGVVAAEQLQQ